jgi:hypothetical protein
MIPEAAAALQMIGLIKARYGIVVPAYDETSDMVLRLLRSIDPDALVILVVNRSVSSPWNVAVANDRLMDDLLERCTRLAVVDDSCVKLIGYDNLPDVLMIDRSGSELISSGVGEARSIGADVLAALIDSGQVASKWMHQTDADTMVPSDLFTRADEVYNDDHSAVCMRAVRCWSADPALQYVADLDDFSGRLALIGYETAHCPWAILTTGCGVAVSRWAYDVIGGIQHYKNAEDGHLLNAAGKIGHVHRLYGGERVLIEARPVSRPPSGYGKTIGIYRDQQAAGVAPTITHPACWAHVAAFYGTIEACLLKGLNLTRASEAGAEAARVTWPDQDIKTGIIRDMINSWIGPLDVMRRTWGSKLEAYLSVHVQLDMRRSQLVKGDLFKHFGLCTVKEALAMQPWPSLRDLALDGSPAEMIQTAMVLEEEKCSGDTGPSAWASILCM